MSEDGANKKRFRRWPPQVGRNRPRATQTEEPPAAKPEDSVRPRKAAGEGPERSQAGKDVEVRFRSRRRRVPVGRNTGD